MWHLLPAFSKRISNDKSKEVILGRGGDGGQVNSILAFYFDDLSSNPAQDDNLI